jgi:hypothetical protein
MNFVEMFFTNIDLHLGHHQIHMKQEYIPKSNLYTHEVHYEFLVIPFGLFNDPSTFKILVNIFVVPFPFNFMLVLFDAILI